MNKTDQEETFYHVYTITNHSREDEQDITLRGAEQRLRFLEVSVQLKRDEEWIDSQYRFIFIGDHNLIAASLHNFEHALIVQASTDKSLLPHCGFRIKHNLHVSPLEFEVHCSTPPLVAYRLKFNREEFHDETGKRVY